MKKVGDMDVYTNHQNISAMERRVLNKLRKTRKCVIKPADKESATVILSMENYIREVHRQLNYTNLFGLRIVMRLFSV